MRRLLGCGLLVAAALLMGCSARNKRCDAPNSGCGLCGPSGGSGGGMFANHPLGNHSWFNKNQPQAAPPGTVPMGAAVVEGQPGGTTYVPPNLQPAPGYGPTPDMTAPPVQPGGQPIR